MYNTATHARNHTRRAGATHAILQGRLSLACETRVTGTYRCRRDRKVTRRERERERRRCIGKARSRGPYGCNGIPAPIICPTLPLSRRRRRRFFNLFFVFHYRVIASFSLSFSLYICVMHARGIGGFSFFYVLWHSFLNLYCWGLAAVAESRIIGVRSSVRVVWGRMVYACGWNYYTRGLCALQVAISFRLDREW